MSHTKLLYHIVFRTKYSIAAIKHESEKDLYRYIWNYCKRNECVLYRIGGMPDHIHMLIQIPASSCMADFVHNLKISTNYFIRNHPERFPDYQGWNKSYFAASCSVSHVNKITGYIANQKKHHETEDSIAEFKRLTESILTA
ncbi:MAG: IS200/IS605 family transposase [Bacteroidetes bacterium]|uniref:IS200/IS605 family transposase n=1 Tax=Candidatus Enterocola intestinipullorum TaxID=2840783 RepID=A0A9D9EFW3_9BACT|nr:IS200/IS605 family transposase [Candidatus Enterocola intestinipullorum]